MLGNVPAEVTMATVHSSNGIHWEELSHDEMVAELNAQTERLLGMTLGQFHEALAAGTLPSTAAVDYLALVTGAASSATNSRP